MNITIFSSRSSIFSNYYLGSFSKLGLNTQALSYDELFPILPAATQRYASYKLLPSSLLDVWSRRLLEKIIDGNPDLVIINKGIFLAPHLIRDLKSRCHVVCVNEDSPLDRSISNSDPYYGTKIEDFHIYYVCCPSLACHLRSAGHDNVKYLPLPSSTTEYYPKSRDRQYFASFVGTYDSERRYFLASTNQPIHVFGPGWNSSSTKDSSLVPLDPLQRPVPTANEVFNGSQVTINLLRNQNRFSINKRFVEAISSGVPLLTPYNRYSQELVSKYALNGVILFKGYDHLRDLLYRPLTFFGSRQQASRDFLDYFSFDANVKRILADKD